MSCPTLDLGSLGLSRGGAILLQRALRQHERVELRGQSAGLGHQVQAWCRVHGHRFEQSPQGLFIQRGRGQPPALERAGLPEAPEPLALPRWGVAPRGAWIEPGAPALAFEHRSRQGLWTPDSAAWLHRAEAERWRAEDLPWEGSPPELEQERALGQLLTWLAQLTQASLAVHARLLGQLHPHFHESVQLLAGVVADLALHAAVYRRRAALFGVAPGTCSAASLHAAASLFDDAPFPEQLLRLDVLAVCGVLPLLGWLGHEGPDPLTQALARRTHRDLERHLGLALAWLGASADPALLDRLEGATRQRHAALRDSSSLSEDSLDSLVVLCAGGLDPARIGRGWDRVNALYTQMDHSRRAALGALGFSAERAASLAALLTRNFF